MKLTKQDRALRVAHALRQAAEIFENHPELVPDYKITIGFGHLNSKEEAAALVRALGTCTKHYDESLFTISKTLGENALDLNFSFWRNEVCERVVVDTIEVEEEVIPERRIPAHKKEIVEWRCGSVLSEGEGEGK